MVLIARLAGEDDRSRRKARQTKVRRFLYTQVYHAPSAICNVRSCTESPSIAPPLPPRALLSTLLSTAAPVTTGDDVDASPSLSSRPRHTQLRLSRFSPLFPLQSSRFLFLITARLRPSARSQRRRTTTPEIFGET